MISRGLPGRNVIRTVKLNMRQLLLSLCLPALRQSRERHGLVAVGAGGDHADFRAGLLLQEPQIILRQLRQLVELGDAFGRAFQPFRVV